MSSLQSRWTPTHFNMNKFGLVLLVVLFGALLFVLGMLAPESLRRPVLAMTQSLEPVKPAPKKAAPQTPGKPAGSEPEKTEKKTEPAPTPYQDLLIPSPLPPDGIYALQVGRFTKSETADALVERARQDGIAVTTIAVQEQNGARWIAVAAGEYHSPDDARAARLAMSRTLELTQGLPVVRLPAKASAVSP